MNQAEPGSWRKTTQYLMPARPEETVPDQYNIYPAYSLNAGQIQSGFADLAEILAGEQTVVIDGYPGVLWESFCRQLADVWQRRVPISASRT